MHSGIVENIRTVRNTQKTGALRKRLFAQLRNLQNILAGNEFAVLFSISDNIFCNASIQTRHILEEGNARRVQIDADAVDAVLQHARQDAVQPLFIHVVLVLTDADGLRVDFDELRERVLQTTRDGYRAALRDVEIGEFLRTQGTGGIHRRTRLGHDHVRNLPARLFLDLLDEFGDKNFALLGCGAVADGDDVDVVFCDKFFQLRLRRIDILLGAGRGIDDRLIQHLARTVYDGDLAAGAVRGVEPERDFVLDGRLHEERL